MQDKDSEALRNQRRRRKRIARMKHTIIAIIAGWIILSMILIIFLLVRTRSMERKLDELWQMQRVMNQQVPDTEALPQEETGGMDTETVAVTASASGIDETDNLAQDGDVHKVYLTFDDGPSENTDAILDVLSEYDVKATFFVTEPYAKAQPELVQRMIDEGHEIGNHSVTHPSEGLPSQSLEQQKNEVMENHQYIKDNFGYDMHLFRFPAGKFSDQSLAVVNNCNYKSVFWSFAYKDYDVNNQPGESEALQKLKDRMHPGAIYLLHAESTTNTAILGRFIDAAQAAGYEVVAFQ